MTSLRAKLAGWGAGVTLLVAASFGVAAAQQQTDSVDPDAELVTQRDVNLTPEQMEASLNE